MLRIVTTLFIHCPRVGGINLIEILDRQCPIYAIRILREHLMNFPPLLMLYMV